MTTTTEPIALDHLAEQLAAYNAVARQIKDLEEMRDKIKQSLTDALGEHEAGTVGGRVVVKQTHVVQHRLSTALVRKRFTEDELADCYQDVAFTKFTWPGHDH
jgi:predicted phage-related endonuclease